MLSISLYYISIVTEFTTYCTWYYIYTGCYTLSISKTSISPRGRSERGLARKAQESKITRGEKDRKKTDILENDEQHPTCQLAQIYSFLFTWKYWLILEFFLSRSLTSTQSKNFYWEKLLSGRGLQAMSTEGTLWILIRKGILWSREFRRHEGQVRQNLPRVHYRLERTMNPAGWQPTKCLCFFEVDRQVEGWLMTTSETRMGSTCPTNEKGIKRKAVVYVYVRLKERKKIGLPSCVTMQSMKLIVRETRVARNNRWVKRILQL